MIPLEPPFDIAGEFAAERARLLDLLRGLDPTAWALPTRCPGWSVLDLTVHLVGDDIGALSWHRDGHRGSGPPPGTDETGFVDWLDALQDDWVRAGRRISPALAIELLDWFGGRLADLIRSDDPSAVDAHVSWASAAPVPRWLDHGRDLTEYWIHRQQLLDALGRPADRDPHLVTRILDVLRWALPKGLATVDAAAGSVVVVELADLGPTRWTLVRSDGGWGFEAPVARRAIATLTCSAEQAWRFLTSNLEPELHGRPRIDGDEAVVRALTRTRAIIGRPEAGERPAPGGGWAAYPVDPAVDPHPGRTALGDDGAPLRPGAPAVVALGALCGLRERPDSDRSRRSYWVAEFVELADGRRLVLHDERGFTEEGRAVVHGDHGPEVRPVALDDPGLEDLRRSVLHVVLPDDDSPDEHPWSWLAELAVRRGLVVTADDLRSVPYEVVLTDDLRARLAPPPRPAD